MDVEVEVEVGGRVVVVVMVVVVDVGIGYWVQSTRADSTSQNSGSMPAFMRASMSMPLSMKYTLPERRPPPESVCWFRSVEVADIRQTV